MGARKKHKQGHENAIRKRVKGRCKGKCSANKACRKCTMRKRLKSKHIESMRERLKQNNVDFRAVEDDIQSTRQQFDEIANNPNITAANKALMQAQIDAQLVRSEETIDVLQQRTQYLGSMLPSRNNATRTNTTSATRTTRATRTNTTRADATSATRANATMSKSTLHSNCSIATPHANTPLHVKNLANIGPARMTRCEIIIQRSSRLDTLFPSKRVTIEEWTTTYWSYIRNTLGEQTATWYRTTYESMTDERIMKNIQIIMDEAANGTIADGCAGSIMYLRKCITKMRVWLTMYSTSRSSGEDKYSITIVNLNMIPEDKDTRLCIYVLYFHCCLAYEL